MKYSAEDIARMRSAVALALSWEQMGTSFFPHERDLLTESRLVTYMANGSTPEELEAEADRAREDYRRRDERNAQRFREAWRSTER